MAGLEGDHDGRETETKRKEERKERRKNGRMGEKGATVQEDMREGRAGDEKRGHRTENWESTARSLLDS